MKEREKKTCRIYLESWQRRMCADMMSARIKDKLRVVDPKVLEIAFGKIKCLASYKLPPDGIRIDEFVLYLTDPQILQIQKELEVRTEVTEVNISHEEMVQGNIQFS